MRGFLARRAFRLATRLSHEEKSVMAIVRMQAIVRGMLWRCKRLVTNTRRRIAAAIKIQAFVRRYLTMRRVQVGVGHCCAFCGRGCGRDCGKGFPPW